MVERSPRPSRSGVSAVLLVLLGAAAAPAVERRVFVTSTSGNGNFSSWAETDSDGLAGADEICRARAAAAQPEPLANANTYRAWLSTAATDAYCHLFGLTGERPSCNGGNPLAPTMGPWFRMNNSVFGGTLAEIAGVDRLVILPVLFDENGSTMRGESVWTGTNVDGEQDTDHCSGWSSTSGEGIIGLPDAVSLAWTEGGSQLCSTEAHLLCFEPGFGDALDLPAVDGALAFVTSVDGTGKLSTWDQTDLDGLDGGDEICQALAEAAFLPRPASFRALLSTASVDARDRVTWGGPFVRADGYVFATDQDDLFGGTFLRTGLVVDETGRTLGNNNPDVWTGSLADGTLAPNRCMSWESEDSGNDGYIGLGSLTDGRWLDFQVFPCSLTSRLYCVSNVEIVFWDNFERDNLDRWWSAVEE